MLHIVRIQLVSLSGPCSRNFALYWIYVSFFCLSLRGCPISGEFSWLLCRAYALVIPPCTLCFSFRFVLLSTQMSHIMRIPLAPLLGLYSRNLALQCVLSFLFCSVLFCSLRGCRISWEFRWLLCWIYALVIPPCTVCFSFCFVLFCSLLWYSLSWDLDESLLLGPFPRDSVLHFVDVSIVCSLRWYSLLWDFGESLPLGPFPRDSLLHFVHVSTVCSLCWYSLSRDFS